MYIEAWSFENFLGNKKSHDYTDNVVEMLLHFQKLVCNTRFNVLFHHSYLDHFSEKFDDLSDEQGERFHQDTRIAGINISWQTFAGVFRVVISHFLTP